MCDSKLQLIKRFDKKARLINGTRSFTTLLDPLLQNPVILFRYGGLSLKKLLDKRIFC